MTAEGLSASITGYRPDMPLNKLEFLRLMKYPPEWLEWDMYPDELFEHQILGYEEGNENGSEHDRNGAFHWWLRRDLMTDQLRKLVLLTFRDPDQLMAADAREYIARRHDLTQEVRDLLRKGL